MTLMNLEIISSDLWALASSVDGVPADVSATSDEESPISLHDTARSAGVIAVADLHFA